MLVCWFQVNVQSGFLKVYVTSIVTALSHRPIVGDVPVASTVRIEIYNILGMTVYDVTHDYAAGVEQIVWNGTDNGGRKVASGVYYYRIETGNFSQTLKMVLLK